MRLFFIIEKLKQDKLKSKFKEFRHHWRVGLWPSPPPANDEYSQLIGKIEDVIQKNLTDPKIGQAPTLIYWLWKILYRAFTAEQLNNATGWGLLYEKHEKIRYHTKKSYICAVFKYILLWQHKN